MDWQSIGMVSGAALLGVGGLQTFASLVALRKQSFRRRVRYNERRMQFDDQFDGALKWARAAKPIFRAWPGERPFRVAAIVDEAIGYKSYYLVPADGRALPSFEPGQYLTFGLPVDPRRKPLVRCYSLSERPREDYYRVTIKLAEPPQRSLVPAGQGSGYFHTMVRVGSTIPIQAPQGAFFLDPTDHLPIVLISGGVGFTPLLSMASSIIHQQTGRTVYWFAGFRNSSEHPCRDQIRELALRDNIHCDISYSQPLATDRFGADYHHKGHAGIKRIRHVLPSNNFQFYVCGPPKMMESLIPELWKWGVPESHVHFEAFGPASVRGLKNHIVTHGPCQIGFAKSRTELTWMGDFGSLLEFAEKQEMPLDSGCRAGNCGQCAVRLLEGNVIHTKTPGVALGEKECLTCIGIPNGDIILEA